MVGISADPVSGALAAMQKLTDLARPPVHAIQRAQKVHAWKRGAQASA
jgi:hypothetical protein